MKSKKCRAALAALLFSGSSLLACGPWFPNNMLDRGDQAVLVAPVADFYHELERMQLAPPKFRAVATTNSFAEETLQSEIDDLKAALKQSGKSAEEADRIVTAHLAERGKLQKFADAYEVWTASAPTDWVNGEEHRGKPTTPEPAFPAISAADGLPGEFADYFEGVIAWNNPTASDKSAAREAWERLLQRPAGERHYKSTWAAYMLGRSWEDEDSEKARDYFKQVRQLAAQGFADPTGLAAASIGWEARLALRANEYQTAIELYLEQYSANGWGAGESLQVALGRAVHAGPSALEPLALNSQTRRLVTAYLISQKVSQYSTYDDASTKSVHDSVKAWLDAVEQADVKDVESAEQFALAAYQANDMPLAARWIQRAGASPTAQWLEAKLLLRAGKVEQATELLSRIADSFPTEEPTNDVANPSAPFEEAIFVFDDSDTTAIPPGRYIRGELGALKLTRREYVQSLDLLLHGDFWTDAAYVADHVLRTDELKNYVDENWPAIEPSQDEDKSPAQQKYERLTSDIRYLLARRLTRESRGPEARPYYPAEWLPSFDEFIQALNTGWNESLAKEERAKGLSAAAFIARTNGMELLGTESGPDWQMYGGNFEAGVTEDSRTNAEAKAVVASADELHRAAENKTDPDRRFHYRYQAAALAWEAAKLLPNNSDETARLLCTAGSWIKASDPKAADLFYKTLVRRCRKTAIGAKADELRWFPELDDDGNIKPARLETLDLPSPAEISGSEGIAEYPIPGKHFIIQNGDHTRDIVAAVRRLGVSMTAKDLFAANPELKPAEYMAGREILIPSPQQASTETETNFLNQPPQVMDGPSASAIPADEWPAATSVELYSVQTGDTTARIARRFGIPIQALLEANPGLDPRRLKVGQQITIPAPNIQ